MRATTVRATTVRATTVRATTVRATTVRTRAAPAAPAHSWLSPRAMSGGLGGNGPAQGRMAPSFPSTRRGTRPYAPGSSSGYTLAARTLTTWRRGRPA